MVEPKPASVKKLNSVETALPLSRIRTIMKSSLDTGQITNEVLFLMAKSTEMFVQHLTKESHAKAKAKDGNVLKYEHLSDYVQQEDNLEFLLQIVPQKIKVKDLKEIMNQRGDDSDNSSESGSSSDGESSDSGNSSSNQSEKEKIKTGNGVANSSGKS